MSDPREACWPPAEDDFDRRLFENVREVGWQVNLIEADDEGPAFAYSVGLFHSFGRPEVVVFGQAPEVMHGMVNRVGEHFREGGTYSDWEQATGVLDDFAVMFREVQKKYYQEYLGYARWFNRGDHFPTLQCVWPDTAGRFPWHRTPHPAMAARQPILSDDRSWPFHEGKNMASFATAGVVDEGKPVLLVHHDEDGSWQFLCGTPVDQTVCRVIAMKTAFELDSTVGEVADLPEGWRAERSAPGAAWVRSEAPEDEQESDDDAPTEAD